jgi:hypothetical protein
MNGNGTGTGEEINKSVCGCRFACQQFAETITKH